MNGLLPNIKMAVQLSVAVMEHSQLTLHMCNAWTERELTKRRSRQTEHARLKMLQAVTQLAISNRPHDSNQQGRFRRRGRDMETSFKDVVLGSKETVIVFV